MRPVQLTIDGQAVPVETRGGRVACAAAAHAPERLFEPAPDQIAGQSAMTAEADPRGVICPTCHAKPGSPCKRPSGHTVFGGDHHAPRKRLASSAGCQAIETGS